jgi:hypothetical protein
LVNPAASAIILGRPHKTGDAIAGFVESRYANSKNVLAASLATRGIRRRRRG